MFQIVGVILLIHLGVALSFYLHLALCPPLTINTTSKVYHFPSKKIYAAGISTPIRYPETVKFHFYSASLDHISVVFVTGSSVQEAVETETYNVIMVKSDLRRYSILI